MFFTPFAYYKSQTIPIIPSISCNSKTNSGGEGITSYNINLDSAGGLLVFEIDADYQPDKFEIIHNNAKKATSGMTVSNSGEYDDLYGNTTIPTTQQAFATNQFIGLGQVEVFGPIPTRQSAFTNSTGSPLTIESGYQQLIWWSYTSSDYNTNPIAVLRVTGPNNTTWNFKRLCNV